MRGHASQADFAAELKVSSQTLGRYEREDRLPDAEFLLLLWEEKHISSDWLLTGIGPKFVNPAAAAADALNRHSDRVREEFATYGDLARIPLYNVKAKAGHGALVTSEAIVDSLAFKRDFLRNELSAGPDDLYLIHVEGDSMEPTLRAGDVILVDHRRNTADREGIYVIRMDDALLVKRLQRQPGGRLIATSDNVVYAPFEIDLKAQENGLAIIGRVVWAGRRF